VKLKPQRSFMHPFMHPAIAGASRAARAARRLAARSAPMAVAVGRKAMAGGRAAWPVLRRLWPVVVAIAALTWKVLRVASVTTRRVASRLPLPRTRGIFGSVRTKLVVAFLGVAALSVAVGLIGFTQIRTVASSSATVEKEHFRPTLRLGQVRASLASVQGDLTADFQTADPLSKDIAEQRAGMDMTLVSQALAEYVHATYVSPKAVERLQTAWFTYSDAARKERFVKSRELSTIDGQNWATLTLDPKYKEVSAAAADLVARESAAAKAAADSAASTAAAARQTMAIFALGAVLVAAVGGILMARRISQPLVTTAEALDLVADGDLTAQVEVRTRDELGRLAEALNRTVTKTSDVLRGILGTVQTLSNSSDGLAAMSTQLAATAEETSVQATSATAAAEQVSANIANVATGAEEMTSSIREIAASVHEASRVASDAVALAASTNTTISKLGDSSAEIGAVLRVITQIAEQTNLLALNATIEAARAGDAGRGFAVVANEVKELARETAEATEDIARKITAIQGDTAEAVEAIGAIATVIDQINEIQTTVASAVEEQTATTNEIGRAMQEAVLGVQEIAGNVAGVATAAGDTALTVAASMRAADELSAVADTLGDLVGRFKLDAGDPDGHEAGHEAAPADGAMAFLPYDAPPGGVHEPSAAERTAVAAEELA
jgi:methyl-accepting chemotaxis protein